MKKSLSAILALAAAVAVMSCEKDVTGTGGHNKLGAVRNDNGQVETPIFDADDVGCSGDQVFVGANIGIRTYPEDSEICYTDDGSTPSKTNGKKYTDSMYQMPAKASVTLKAIAFHDGWTTSEVASRTFNIPKCPTPDLIVYSWWNNRILLNWHESENASEYIITYVKKDSGETPATKRVGRLIGYTYIDDEDGNLPKGTMYDISIQADSDYWLPSDVHTTIGYTTKY